MLSYCITTNKLVNISDGSCEFNSHCDCKDKRCAAVLLSKDNIDEQLEEIRDILIND